MKNDNRPEKRGLNLLFHKFFCLVNGHRGPSPASTYKIVITLQFMNPLHLKSKNRLRRQGKDGYSKHAGTDVNSKYHKHRKQLAKTLGSEEYDRELIVAACT